MEQKIFTNLPFTSKPFKLKDVYNKCSNITTKPSIRFYLQKLRDNKHFTKPSVERREEMIKAKFKQSKSNAAG